MGAYISNSFTIISNINKMNKKSKIERMSYTNPKRIKVIINYIFLFIFFFS